MSLQHRLKPKASLTVGDVTIKNVGRQAAELAIDAPITKKIEYKPISEVPVL